MKLAKSKIDQFLSEHGEDLENFFREAVLNGYGSNSREAIVIVGADGGTKISLTRGDWNYQDEFFGGEPFAGMTHISYKNRTVFVMNYDGVVEDQSRIKEVYACLHAALMNRDKELPWRGPLSFTHENGLQYICSFPSGTPPKSFMIEEFIVDNNKPSRALYRASFHGRLVNMG